MVEWKQIARMRDRPRLASLPRPDSRGRGGGDRRETAGSARGRGRTETDRRQHFVTANAVVGIISGSRHVTMRSRCNVIAS